ncbi:hypothetical protein JF550_14150 [Microbacterium esteraromaticum]|uniref:Uncharacterized protein n=1 Tax=Microbacterium esteraromaticum TaxID=57043 RepID=A0A939DY77_9MICO|nr:hypothetical protein [Microbacterium esteraromaticum]MBN8207090.1 hypothetical protein [Microbacterium esteraromaticum]MBN8417244.1 hypothetical protein [Microbacterium esteraromaticum]
MTGPDMFTSLPTEIRRRETLAAEEAVTGVRWLDACAPHVGRKVSELVAQLSEVPSRVYSRADAHRRIASSEGRAEQGSYEVLREGADGDGADDDRLDTVAAIVYAYVWLSENDRDLVLTQWDEERVIRYRPGEFIEAINDILLAARIEWHFEHGRFSRRGNSILHAEIVRPVSVLLDAQPSFARASAAFQTAIDRLSEDHLDAAVTDAGTAVQEFFRALGIDGNSLLDQLNAAQRGGLLEPHDRLLLKPIIDWLNADRSSRGNAHHHRAADVTKSDAWLAIHVAGALIARLATLEPRRLDSNAIGGTG